MSGGAVDPNGSTLRVAAVQMRGVPERAAGLTRAELLVDDAVASGAELVVLPELFACFGDRAVLRGCAEVPGGETSSWASRVARRHAVHLLAGSHVEADGDRLFNTSTLWGPDGSLVAGYRKVHLFDNDVPGAAFRESEVFSPGARRELVMLGGVGVGGVGVGLTICYDIRFPELYRALAAEGARILAVPSAFADATGRDHWETLVRARAIENAAFVIAPNQARGETGPLVCHGHSMIVDPWGEILAEAGGSDETVIVADLDFGLQDGVRARLPSLAHRRPDVYREA